MDFDQPPRGFYDGCIRTYGAATRMMGEVWENAMGERMERLPGSPKERFKHALRLFEGAIADKKASDLEEALRQAAAGDEVLSSLIDESLGKPEAALSPDVDDVPPAIFKQAIWDEASDWTDHNVIDVDLDIFLRAVVGRVVKAMGWERRFNVGENRHFPRMMQWLREVEQESAWDEGCGLRLMNRSGSGFVAAAPRGPHSLKVRLDADWL